MDVKPEDIYQRVTDWTCKSKISQAAMQLKNIPGHCTFGALKCTAVLVKGYNIDDAETVG